MNEIKVEDSKMEDDAGLISRLWFIALIVFIIATARTCYTLNAERDTLIKIRSKVSYLAGLQAIQSDLARGLAAASFVGKSADKHAASLPELMSSTLGELKPDEIKDARKETIQGWVVLQKEMTFGEAPVDKVMEFISKAEAQHPPWSVTRFVIRSSPRAPGMAKIELTLQAVEKAQ